MTNIFDAIKNNNLEQLKKAIEEGDDVNKANSNGFTPLFIAAQEGHLEVVKYLLAQRGIEVNKADNKYGATPLHVAARNGHLEVVQHLLEQRGIEVNKATTIGITPLHFAAQNGHLEVVQHLLKQGGIEVNKANKYGSTPLYIAAHEGHLEVVQHLLKQGGIEVNKADNQGLTPLFIAAYKGHLEIVQHLLAQEGIEVNKAGNYGDTPLHVAAQENHVNIGANLLIHGANFDIVQSGGDFYEFYNNAINHIAQGSIDYGEYPQKKLAFVMGDHPRLGANSNVRNIDDNAIRTILDLAEPPKIELNKMQQQHRNAVQQMISELQQGKVAPGIDVAANGHDNFTRPSSIVK